MTLRARPVARRRSRAGWDSGDRRNNLINLGFFAAIGISVVILIGYAAFSWYDDHFGTAATVNGQVITKDHVRNRLAIEAFRLEYIEQRIRTLQAKRRISAADAQSQFDFLTQRRNQITALSVERLVDVALQAKLAGDNGITVTEQEVEEQLVSEATTSEQRHVWMIEIEPEPDRDTGEVGDEERRTALGRAQRALARLKAGESWEDVARTASDSGIAAQSGDLGWLSEDSGYDESFMEAVFAAELHAPTNIVEGDDEVFRIGRATEMAPEEIDPNFQGDIERAGILLADYRVAARADVVRTKLSDKVVADMSQPGLQRNVLEIYLPEPNESSLGGGEPGVKVRHILYAPKDDPDGAEELPDDDPAWAAAKAEADAAYAALKANITRFDARARAESDEASARATGGKQPWYYPSSTIDPAFRSAIFAEGLEPGQLLEPVKSEFGWHVIQLIRPTGEGDRAFLEDLKADLTDEAKFRQAARDYSEGEEAGEGGDLGWIAKGELAADLDTAVFATAIGAMSNVIAVSGDGVYLLRVLAEETRTPTEEQISIFEDNGFQTWYTAQKEAADITYNLETSSGTS
jgi:parvulin-like peptidyl-prolyl isomerase